MSESEMRWDAKMRKRAERNARKDHDPWFGKRRRAGEISNKDTRAAKHRSECRGFRWRKERNDG